MSTRSTIAVQHPSGTVSQIYCHSDGYLSWNGAKLIQHYNTLELATELVSMGDASVLYERIHPIGDHSFDGKREKGVCVFYGRDRIEAGVEPIQFSSIENYYQSAQFQGYDYIFTNGEWLVQFLTVDEAIPLKEALLRFERETAIKIGLTAGTSTLVCSD